MRVFLVSIALVAGGASAWADEPNRLSSARGHFVAVIDGESREWQGRLLEIDAGSIVVEVDSSPRRFPLASVKRVDAHGDRVWDGAVRGAVIAGVLAGVVTRSGQIALHNALVWGLLGTGIDALHNCTHTVYRAPAPALALGARISW